MKIVEKEIIADEGKYISRKGTDSYFKRCTLLKDETVDNFVEIDSLPDPDLVSAKEKKISEITSYDTSSSVNSFFLDDMEVWLDKATRVGLMNSTQIEKAAGNENTTLWMNNISLVINCDKAIQMLSALEMYALECFNKTAEHKSNVMKLTTVKEVEDYDFTVGYPEKLRLTTK